MKSIILIILSFTLFVSCSNPFESEPQCPCMVKIPQLQKDGTYRMEVVELKTLESVKKIGSSKIQLSVDPQFFNDGTLDAKKPEAQFIVNEDGVIIPTSTDTSQMFSIYKVMEDIYFFDKSIGADKLLTYPRNVSLQTRSTKNVNPLNRVSYKSFFDRIVIFKYVGGKIPLSINSGVLSHEHFHAIFSNLLKPIENTLGKTKKDSIEIIDSEIISKNLQQTVGYNFLILKALDEGMADFWAALQTGLENPYLASFESKDKMHERSVLAVVNEMDEQAALENIFDFSDYQQEEKFSANKNRPTHGSVYSKGTMYSNLLKSLSEKIVSEKEPSAKLNHGQWIVESLKKLEMTVKAKGKQEILTQADIINSFIPDGVSNEILKSVCADTNIFLKQHDKAPKCLGL